MNDRQDPYGQIYGYDEYGRPLYRESPSPEQQHAGYGHDPYAAQSAQAPPYGQQPSYDAGYGYEPSTGQAQQPGYGDADAGYPYGPGAGGGTGAPDPYAAPHAGQGYAQQHPFPQQYQPSDGQGYDYAGRYPGYDTGTQPPVPGAAGPPGDPAYGGGRPGPEATGYAAPPAGTYPAAPAAGGGYDHGTGEHPPVPPADDRTGSAAFPAAGGPAPSGQVPGPRSPADDGSGEDDYRTEQFSFVEEQDEESEEVIDWLKFTESRTERREESKRRAHGRRKLLVVLVALVVIASAGFLWATDRVPFLSGDSEAENVAADAESRDVIILHLRETGGETNSTALLVANETSGAGTTLLLPSEMVVSPDGGTTTLGQAVQDEGAASVREAVGTLLGAEIKGTWRLDTPYLENLVDLIGGVAVTVDAEVPGEDGPLIEEGEQTLDGQKAVVYALHRAEEEPQNAQLDRFGAVMSGVLDKLPDTEDGAHRIVENLAQIADPSLSEEELGASLAQLAGMAQGGQHATSLLEVEEDGTISDALADGLVAEVLGGTVSNADLESGARIAMRDGSGSETAAESVRIALVNGGFTVVDTKGADAVDTSEVRYSEETYLETALEVARTLGIPEDGVMEADTPGNADVAVVIGADLDD